MARTSIWWVRRDLRLTDNKALSAAIDSSEQVIPLFIKDPLLLNSDRVGPKRLAFLWAGLAELDKALRELGSYLVVRSGLPDEVLKEMVEDTGVESIFAEGDYSPYARQRDKKVGRDLPITSIGSPGLSHPGGISKEDGSPYTVYTPYRKRWMAEMLPKLEAKIPAPPHIKTPDSIPSEGLPQAPASLQNLHFLPGEEQANRRLDWFTEAESAPISGYSEFRDRMDIPGTSQLSPYLRFGMLSARQVVARALDLIESARELGAQKGPETWLNELVWREFYFSIIYYFPWVVKESFQADLRDIAWVNNEWEFEQWCLGKTGYPVVDAGMRQLSQIGWMHNRARMVTASFLVKDLLVDWRWGEGWFMQHLIDGDVSANNGGWQWTAGTGTDAAPYFRIFNPITQGKKFDPHGDFVRQWVPELTDVPEMYVHTPWEMPPELQAQTNCRIGIDYPKPIVEHQFARQRTLEVYKQAKNMKIQGES